MDKKLQILILEDDRDDAFFVTRELEKAGFSFESTRVDKLDDFREAVAKMPDVILADYSLPQFNALDALAAMEDLDISLPFVLISGKISEETAVRCIKEGASDYVNKNDLAPLANTVRQALAEHAFREEKLQMERALTEREKKYRKLFEDSSEGIVITSLGGEIIDCNQAFENLLGYSRNELIGQMVFSYYKDQEKIEYVDALLQQNEVVENFEIDFIRKDGRMAFGLATLSFINNDAGERDQLLIMVRDVTDRVKGQRELQMLNAINSAFRIATDNQSLYPILMELLIDTTNAKGAALELVSQINGKLELEAATGVWESLDSKGGLFSEAFPEDLLDRNEPRIWKNSELPEQLSKSDGKDLSSIVCLPMHSSDIDIGLIWLGCGEDWHEDNLHMIQALVQITANTIHRFNLNENTLRALQESQAVARISRTLNEHLDLGKIFSLIVEEAVKIVSEAHRAVIHLYDEDKQRLHAVGFGEKNEEGIQVKTLLQIRVNPRNEFDFGFLSEEDIRAASMSSGKGIAGLVIKERRTISVGNARKDTRYLRTEGNVSHLSLVVAPIMSGSQPLGTLSVLSRKEDAFDSSVERVLENLCVQAATAIENARVLEAERQAREIAEAQTAISTLLNRSLELDEVLGTIIDYAIRVFKATAANIVLFQKDGRHIFMHSSYKFLGKAEKKHTDVIEEYLDAVYQREKGAVDHSILIQDTWNDPNWQLRQSADWVRSFASVPLFVGKEIIGMFIVESDQANAFGEREMQLFEVFANSAASAVNNARLYADLETALITEQNTRARLIRADKLAGMGRMVASVAHELNNPLQTIKNCLFLIEQSSVDAEAAEILDLGMSEVERLSGIVGRLREVYRPSSGQEYKPVPLVPLLEETEVLLETHLRRNKVEYIIEESKVGNPCVLGYPDRLKQVFINLSLNAIEAMQPDGGDLTIRLLKNKRERQVGIAFSDTGFGISPTDMTLIFDPFYTTKDTGMGLGLSICYDIVRDHSGSINVENNKDAGATFTVWLPLTTEQLE